MSEKTTSNFTNWFNMHAPQLAMVNVYLVALVLLRSAGYFEPYLTISINFIFVSTLILAILILGIRSKGVLIFSLFFWILACLLTLLKINVWAERAVVYSYDSLVLGVLIMLLDQFGIIGKAKKE